MQPIPEIDLLSNIRESDVAHPTDGRRQLSLTDEDFTPRPVASRTDWSTVAARPTEHVGGHEWEMGNGLRSRKKVYGSFTLILDFVLIVLCDDGSIQIAQSKTFFTNIRTLKAILFCKNTPL